MYKCCWIRSCYGNHLRIPVDQVLTSDTVLYVSWATKLSDIEIWGIPYLRLWVMGGYSEEEAAVRRFTL